MENPLSREVEGPSFNRPHLPIKPHTIHSQAVRMETHAPIHTERVVPLYPQIGRQRFPFHLPEFRRPDFHLPEAVSQRLDSIHTIFGVDLIRPTAGTLTVAAVAGLIFLGTGGGPLVGTLLAHNQNRQALEWSKGIIKALSDPDHNGEAFYATVVISGAGSNNTIRENREDNNSLVGVTNGRGGTVVAAVAIGGRATNVIKKDGYAATFCAYVPIVPLRDKPLPPKTDVCAWKDDFAWDENQALAARR